MLALEIKTKIMNANLCRNLAEDEIDLLIKRNKLIRFETGERIIRQGEVSPGLFIIIEGRVSVAARILGKGLENFGTREAGDYLGEISFIEKGRCTTTAIADTQVFCLLVTREYYKMLGYFMPDMKYRIGSALVDNIITKVKIISKEIFSLTHHYDSTKKSFFSKFIPLFLPPKKTDYYKAGFDEETLLRFLCRLNFEKNAARIIIEHSNLITTHKNATLINSNKSNNSFYLIIRGAVQSALTAKDQSIKLSILSPAHNFCSVGLVSPELKSLVHYEARERVILLEITSQQMQFLKEHHPEIGYKLFDLICDSFAYLERTTEKLYIRLNNELYD